MNIPDNPHSERGFSLAEMTVAAFLFSIVILAVLLLYDMGNRSTAEGEQAADLQQNTRVGFDRMMDELRMVGFDYDRDGDRTPYPDQPDEAIEYTGDHAITIRANLDHTNADGGREPALEDPSTDPNYGDVCCPIVTTGNDEIITYALVSKDASANTDSIRIKVDTSTPRDAYVDGTGSLVGEEVLTLTGVDLTVDNPPYTLYRYVVNAAGSGFVATPVAENVRALNFTYSDARGNDYFCLDWTLGTCAETDKIPFGDLGGSNRIHHGESWYSGPQSARAARDTIRAVDVEFIGMESARRQRWNDPRADPADAGDQKALHYKKFRLVSRVTPPNLGRTGEPDLSNVPPDPPTNVVACSGQCDVFHASWDAPANAAGYTLNVYRAATDPPELVYTVNTPGNEIAGSQPIRVWEAVNRNDDLAFVAGASFYARVIARNSKGMESDESLASNVATLTDVVRPEAPTGLIATGYDWNDNDWPDTSILPVTATSTDPSFPRENKVVVYWDPPRYALDVTDQSSPATTWTTQVNDLTLPPLDCDSEMADTDGDGVGDKARTPLREVYGDVRYLLFRSHDPHFVPTDRDFIAEVHGDFDPDTGKVFFEDDTEHVWDASGNWIRTRSALPCCTPWYYRIRSADACWDGDTPASRTDVHLSPFYPPLNTGDVPDSDDVAGLAPTAVGLGTPGYAIPDAAPGAPQELRYHDGVDNGTNFFFWARFRAPKKDQATDPLGNPAPKDAAYRTYLLYSHPTDPNYTLTFDGRATGDGRIEDTITVYDVKAGIVDRDDENGDGFFQNEEDETWAGKTNGQSDLRIKGDLTPRYYRIVAVQCQDDSIAADGTDVYAYDVGEPSPAIRIPCEFGMPGGLPADGLQPTLTIDTNSWPDYVFVYTTLVAGTADYARLEVSLPSSGESAMSDPPGIGPDSVGSNSFTFDADHIHALTQRMTPGSPVFVRAEVRDSNGCYGYTNKVLETVGLPSCCIRASDPVASTLEAGVKALVQFQEKCNADPLFIKTINFQLGNENGGHTEIVKRVYHGQDLIYQGSGASGTIDLTSNPILLQSLESDSLLFDFNGKDATLDSLQIQYIYDIGNTSGDCIYTEGALD